MLFSYEQRVDFNILKYSAHYYLVFNESKKITTYTAIFFLKILARKSRRQCNKDDQSPLRFTSKFIVWTGAEIGPKFVFELIDSPKDVPIRNRISYLYFLRIHVRACTSDRSLIDIIKNSLEIIRAESIYLGFSRKVHKSTKKQLIIFDILTKLHLHM